LWNSGRQRGGRGTWDVCPKPDQQQTWVWLLDFFYVTDDYRCESFSIYAMVGWFSTVRFWPRQTPLSWTLDSELK
jgi:hypothetical protein